MHNVIPLRACTDLIAAQTNGLAMHCHRDLAAFFVRAKGTSATAPHHANAGILAELAEFPDGGRV